MSTLTRPLQFNDAHYPLLSNARLSMHAYVLNVYTYVGTTQVCQSARQFSFICLIDIDIGTTADSGNGSVWRSNYQIALNTWLDESDPDIPVYIRFNLFCRIILCCPVNEC